MGLRSLNFDKRVIATAKVIESHLPSGATHITIKKWSPFIFNSDLGGSEFANIDILTADKILCQVVVREFGMGKPEVRYKKDEDKETATKLAREIKRSGKYIFMPLVERVPYLGSY
ncbi:MAG: hypothetical protein AABX38_02845 [Candidatus Micrarchaeota archaeon]